MLKFAPIVKAPSLLYQRYRFISLAVYGTVLLARLFDWIYGGIGPRALVKIPQEPRFAGFIIAVLGLIWLEWRVALELLTAKSVVMI